MRLNPGVLRASVEAPLRSRLLWLGLSLLVVVDARPALACSCVSNLPTDDEGRRKRYSIVLLGTTKSWTCVDPESEKLVSMGLADACREYQAVLSVVAVWKGKAAKEVTVRPGRGSCGDEFRVGETYLVFGQPTATPAAGLATNLCHGNHKATLEDVRKLFGKEKKAK